MHTRFTSLILFIVGILILFQNNEAFAQCTAGFTFDDTDITIQFIDQSTSQAGDPIVSWFWDFDDGSTSDQQNPLHTFPEPDKYDVELFITTANGCQHDIKIRVEICVLPTNISVGSCDANGDIPIDITVSDTYDNAKEVDISIDGTLIPGSPFDIDAQNPVMTTASVSGDGLQHVLLVQSTDIPTCNSSTTFIVPDCNSNCFLSALQVSIANGTTQTVNVGQGGNNVFAPTQTTITIGDEVSFNFVDNGHTTTSDANSGPDSWNSGELGAGSVYIVNIKNPAVHPYYCIPHGGPGGAGMSGTIIANCPSGNSFTLDVEFNTSQANPGGYNILVDGIIQAGSPFAYNGTGPQSATITLAGDGQTHLIEVIDVDEPSCQISTNFLAPNCGAAPTCQLTLSAQEISGCDAADNVDVELTVTSINGGSSGFDVFVDGVLDPGSPYAYDPSGTTVLTLSIAGDGQPHDITATDVDDSNCTSVTTITTTNCTIPCQISNVQASTGGGATHTVLVEDFVFTPADVTITAGDIVEWQWTGAVDHTSTSDAGSGPDSWDSGLLGQGSTYQSPVLSTGIHPYFCEPHGSAGGVGMAGTISVQANCTNGEVSVNVTFDETGGGFGGYNVLIDGQVSAGSPYAYDASGSNSVSVFVIGDGQSHSIEIVDVDDGSCSGSTSIVTPDCNAPSCQLTLSAQEVSGCDANNEVGVELTVSDVGGGASGFEVWIDASLEGSYAYSGSGTTIVSVSIAGDGQSHDIEVRDIDEAGCTAMTTITTTDCIIPCQISNVQASTGGGATHTVLVEDFVFTPADVTITAGDIVEWQWTGAVDHTSTSDAGSGPDSWDSGLLGQGSTYQSPVLSTGIHPYYCEPHGSAGGVGMAGTISVQANCTNGEVSVNVTFDETGGGFGGYNVLIDGQVSAGSPYAYDASGSNSVSVFVIGDGQSHSIEIVDVDDGSCSGSTSIVTPDCNAPSCQLTLSAQEVSGCDANDEVSVELTVSDVGGGASGFEVWIDASLEGSYAYSGSGTTIVSVSIAGDGQSHDIEVRDIDEAGCTAMTTITTTDCIIPCQISNVQASTGGGATHTVLVEDFVFTPADVTITAGDIVEWQWTGAVDHTSTSDAGSGPDSWDSGLLGQGSTYQSPVLSTGIHPYFCEPHGSAGGVGMAGTISVQANCTNGEVSVNVTFDETGGGFGGYNVLIDGQVSAGSPYAYDASGSNSVSVFVIGDGQSHSIEIVDVDDGSCSGSTSIVTPDCNAPSCQLTLSAQEVSGCDANNEVGVELTVSDVGGGASGFEVWIDASLEGSYAYSGSGTTIVSVSIAGDGQPHDIEVRDIDEAGCIAMTTITTTDCTIPCQITDVMLIVPGAGNPLTHVVEVDDFKFIPKDLQISVGDTVSFVWIGNIGHTATSDDQSSNDAFESGLLNQGAVFKTDFQEEGMHPYYCKPHGSAGGIGMAGSIEILPPSPDCNANGEVNVQVSFTAAGQGSQGYIVLVDGSQQGAIRPYQGNSNTTDVWIAGDGANHVVTVQDAENSACMNIANIITPVCTTGGNCSMDLELNQVSDCDPQDSVLAGFTVISSQSGNSGFILFVDGSLHPQSPFSYTGDTTDFAITLVGNGISKNIVVQDADSTSCMDSVEVEVPTCFDFCQILNINTTFNQPATHYIEVKEFIFEPGILDILVNDTVVFYWTGVIPHTSTSDAISGENSWNSGLLNNGDSFAISLTEEGMHPYYCEPHGGPNGIGQSGVIHAHEACNDSVAIITVSFEAHLGGDSGYRIFVDGTLIHDSIPYDDPNAYNQLNISVPADAEIHLLTIQDVETGFCAATVPFTAPSCIVGDCDISGLQIEEVEPATHIVEVRDFVFVPEDVSINLGDTVRFVWTGAIPHTSTSDTTSGVDSWESGLLSQGDTFDLILQTEGLHPYYCIPHGGPNGIGMAGTIMVVDERCKNATIPLIAQFTQTGSGRNGFQVFVDSLPISDTAFVYQGINNSIALELPGDGQPHQVVVADIDDPTCADTLDYLTDLCDKVCALNTQITAVGTCDTNQMIPIEITLDHRFTGTTFGLSIDGGDTSQYAYHPSGVSLITLLLAGDGMQHQIHIFDLDSSGCHTDLFYQTIDCSPACMLSATATQSSGCDSEDMLSYALEIFMQGASSTSFNVFIDGTGIPANPHTYTGDTTILSVLLPGDGQEHSIIITDSEESNCSDTLSITSPDCSISCNISNFDYTFSAPKVHIVKVLDFEYEPEEISVHPGDTIRFEWEGEVPHTVTSDTTSGDDVFESGLLGQGSVFDLVLQEVRDHPYYCIPHGAPGGIGMAGIIHVVEDCADDSLFTSFSYEIVNPGLAGYNVFLAGDLIYNADYETGIGQQFAVTLPANGSPADLLIQDVEKVSCLLDTLVQMPNCNDPCFGFEAEFDFQVDHSTFTATFQALTSGATSWLWTFGTGDASVIETPLYEFPQAGIYEICLTVTNDQACTDTYCENIEVGRYECQANFSFELDGLTLTLTDESVTTEPVDSWSWNFGNNTIIVGQSTAELTYDSLGVYTVCLEITAGACVSDTCVVLDLTDPCLTFRPDFKAVTDGSQLNVQFVDLSSGDPNKWLWGFGDGFTTNEQNPEHTYAQMGNYKVCLLAQQTDIGCNKSHCEFVEVGVVGIQDIKQRYSQLLIYPNPVSKNQLLWTIEGILAEDYNQSLQMLTYNLQGQVVLSMAVTGAEHLQVQADRNLAAGMYILELRSIYNIYRAKIYVQ